MIALSTTVSHSFSWQTFNNQNQAWSYHKVTLHFEKHPNMSQSAICFRDIASVLAIDITKNKINGGLTFMNNCNFGKMIKK